MCKKKNKKSIPDCQTLGAVVGTMGVGELGSLGVRESGSLGVGESGSLGVWECRLFDFLSADTQTNKASHLSTVAVVIMLSPVCRCNGSTSVRCQGHDHSCEVCWTLPAHTSGSGTASEELDLLQCLFSSGIYYLFYAVSVEVSLRPAFLLSSPSSIPHHCSTGATTGLCYLNCSLPHSSTLKDSSDIHSTLHSS